MENYVARFSGLKEPLRRLTVAFTGTVALCAISCRSMKQMEWKERSLQTERIGQEVILLPESERLLVDLSALENMPRASTLTKPKETDKGGLTVKKRPDGLIEIESRRDTIRIRSDTVCNHSQENTEVMQKKESGNAALKWLSLFLLICLFVYLLRR